METYQRRRFRKGKEAISSDSERPVFVNNLPVSEFSEHRRNTDDVGYSLPALYQFRSDRIEVGSVYEVDHCYLPVRTPLNLRSIRVVMVSEKTKLNVAVRFPSPGSLKTFFSNCIGEMYPALDEKFVMGTALASKVLSRKVPSQQFAGKKHLKEFWLAPAKRSDTVELTSESNGSYSKGTCLTELMKRGGLASWGTRRQVVFLKKHKEELVNNNAQSSSSLSMKKTESTEGCEKPEDTEDDTDEEEEDGDDEEQEAEEQEGDEMEDNKEAVDILDGDSGEEGDEKDLILKRKRYVLRKSTRKNTEKSKVGKKNKQKQHQRKKQKTTKRSTCKDLVLADNHKDRWSAERYQTATESLLAVMKSKKATAGNPILRPNLREEARKRIGDTGLLDHLLKHMAGELAPDGKVRFRRRHNAEGAMEYWLESADLVNIRLQAGVLDPYWVPPPGWEPGDCPTQDPILAKELKLLKQEVTQLNRYVKDMVPKKQMEKEVRKLRREMEKLVSSKQQEQNLAIQVSQNPSDIGHKLNQLANLLDSSRSDVSKAPSSMVRYNKQLLAIQDVLTGIQAEIKSSLPRDLEGKTTDLSAAEMVLAEENGGKLERQKSGFRICKPQGTFLWPNVTDNNSSDTVVTTTNTTASTNLASSQVVVQFDDLFAVPTPPPLVSSSTVMPPPQLTYHPNILRPASPVKPLAEKRAVTVTVSTVSNDTGADQGKYGPKLNLNADLSSSILRRAASAASVSTPCISEKTWLALGTANSASRTPPKKSEYRDVLNLSTQ